MSRKQQWEKTKTQYLFRLGEWYYGRVRVGKKTFRESFHTQGKFMKESYPRKWVLEPRRPQPDGFCIFAGARFLAAVKCWIRLSAGWFWAGQSLVWT